MIPAYLQAILWVAGIVALVVAVWVAPYVNNRETKEQEQ